MKKTIDRLKRMFIMGFRQIQDPYYQGFAAQISFYLMLSVTPLCLIIVQILGVFNINTEMALDIVGHYFSENMTKMIGSFLTFNSIGAGNIVFLLITLWSGSRASFAIARITNYTITEGKSTGKNYFIERARAILTMLLTIIGLIVAIVILCYGKVILLAIIKILSISNTEMVDSFWMWLRWPLGFFLYLLVLGYNYYILELPTERKSFKTVMPGATFASLGLLVVSWGYSYYTETLADYDITYGALSSVVAIMIWFFLLSWVIILGVMVNKVFDATSQPFSKTQPPEHLKYSQRAKQEKSKFDIDPDDVSISTIKDILMYGADSINQPEEQIESENLDDDAEITDDEADDKEDYNA